MFSYGTRGRRKCHAHSFPSMQRFEEPNHLMFALSVYCVSLASSAPLKPFSESQRGQMDYSYQSCFFSPLQPVWLNETIIGMFVPVNVAARVEHWGWLSESSSEHVVRLCSDDLFIIFFLRKHLHFLRKVKCKMFNLHRLNIVQQTDLSPEAVLAY